MTMLRAPIGALCLALSALPALAQDGDEVVARVNGVEVTRDDVVAGILELPAEYQQLGVEILWEPMLQQAIDRRLVVEAARADGLDESEAYRAQLARLGDQLLQQLFFESILADPVPQDEVRAAYDTWAAEFEASGAGEEVHARHILVLSEEEARDVVGRLEAGEDFAAVAAETSVDPSGLQGGELGWFRHDDMVPEFADAAFALEPGATSAPVQSPFGWHVIVVEERRTAPTPAFEQLAPQFETQIVEERIYGRIDALREDAEIEILGAPATTE